MAYPTAAVRHRQQRVTLSHWPIVNSPEAKSVFRKFVSSLTIETMQAETGRQVAVALYVVAMVAVIADVRGERFQFSHHDGPHVFAI